MKSMCAEVRERIAEHGAAALRDDVALTRHVEECESCFATLEGMAGVDEALQALPERDAPQHVVDDLLRKVRAERVEATSPRPWLRPAVFASLASAGLVVVVVGVAMPSLLRARVSAPPPRSEPAPEVEALEFRGQRSGPGQPPATLVGARENEAPLDGKLSKVETDRLKALGYVGGEEIDASKKEKQDSDDKPKDVEKGAAFFDRSATLVTEDKRSVGEKRRDTTTEGFDAGVVGGVGGGVVGGAAPVRVGGNVAMPRKLHHVAPELPDGARQARVEGVVILDIMVSPEGKVQDVKVLRGVPGLDVAAVAAVRQWVYEPTLVNGEPVTVFITVTVPFRVEASPSPVSDAAPNDAVRAFTAERARIESLPFEPTQGYWSNTYLPGDPVVRMLQARLHGNAVRLHEAAQPILQPFDAGHASALSVFVSADRVGTDGPARTLLQVGLRATDRSSGVRAPMDLAIVLDLRGDPSPEAAAGLRAVALAWARAARAGDRFRLLAAGRATGVVVGPDAWKSGEVAVAVDRLLAAPASGPGLVETFAAAVGEVCGHDDGAIGGSGVVLVTAQPLGDEDDVLLPLVRRAARAGVLTTAVGIGTLAPPADVEKVAFAGEGRRRILDAPADAERLVEAELAASADVVARAVRLQVRLAPGVQLVQVVGTHRLGAPEAEAVRQSEQAIDQRLAAHLGLGTDRGDDEDGIQIVIPAFQAGDAHVVLLDVVAPGPGPLAEVGVRFKDLVGLRNGTARTSLELRRGAAPSGPRELNVVKNLLAARVAEALRAAADALHAGDAERAASDLEPTRQLLAGIGAARPGLRGDADLRRDVALLDTYAGALRNAASEPAALVDSMRLAAHLKLGAPGRRSTNS